MTLNEIPVVLASGSPRRRELLQKEGVEPYIIRPGCSEDICGTLRPERLVMSLAARKGLCGVEMLKEDSPFEDYLLLASDTVVAFGDEILEKPEDEEDAFRMLKIMSGKVNTVYSGVFMYRRSDGRKLCFYDATDVYFKEYGDRDIWDYIATGEPMDKAGAYAIQGGFAKYVERTEGDMNCVIGFPLKKIKEMLADF